MQKIKLSTIELVFIIIAASILFIITVHQMSSAGILPGNDPAVHLGKSATIVIDQKVTYSTVPWYPPLFHTLLAILQILAGTLDVIAAAFILKMLIATLNVLILLSTYLLCKKLFGIGIGVTASVFVILSVPLSEMIFWGGYANFLGLAYIAFIFYILNKDMHVYQKTFFLFIGSFTIVLSHQLATFVFVLMFIPAFLVTKTSSKKRKILVFFGIIVGGGLALLAWYARLIIEYSNRIIEHLFFTMTETVYNIPEVGLDALIRNNFGASLYIALLGIPLTIILLKKKKNLTASILIFTWISIPFLLSQSYIFGFYLPYIRFVYFFATPLAILAGILTYSLTKIPAIFETIISQNIKGKQIILKVTKVFALVSIVSLFILQGTFFLQRTETYPEFYERSSISSYNSALWIKQYSSPEGRVVSSRSPGSWLNILSERETIQETDPQYYRNAIAESVLYGFYEMHNTRTLIQEYTSASPNPGLEMYVAIHNIWNRGISIPNEKATVIHIDPFGRWREIPLSETDQNIYWTITTPEKTQLISEYSHELFKVTKTVTFSSNSSVVDINWLIEAHKNLANVKLEFGNFMDLSFDFKKALVPGVLEWQNPWDKATYVNEEREWVVIEDDFDRVEGNVIAILDSNNQILGVFDFHDTPNFFTIGALENKLIDLLTVRYELGYLEDGMKQEVSFSTLLCNSDFEGIKQFEASEFIQEYDSTAKLDIEQIDFPTYIEEYDIKLVVVDTQPQQVLSEREVSPDLDRLYDNGRITVYTTKR
ncbi:hypothetical protein ACFLRN_03560 [Thermoproteota archaeon]